MSFLDLGNSPLRPQPQPRSPQSSSGRTPVRGHTNSSGEASPSSASSSAGQNRPLRPRPTPEQRARLYHLQIVEQSIYEGGVLRAFQAKILNPDSEGARELFLQFRKIVSSDVPFRERDPEVEKREAMEMWDEVTRIVVGEMEERERKKNVSRPFSGGVSC